MTLISRIGSALLMLAIVLPATTATFIDKPETSCGENKFLFKWKKTCVPFGGMVGVPRPTPPKGSDCPPLGWYWGNKEGCCVPEEPEKDEEPEPQCRKGWKWLRGDHRCCEDENPHQPPAPQPSNHPGGPGNGHGPGHGHHKRQLKARTVPLCPGKLEACPFSSLSKDFECIDPNSDIESCGGCPALGKGQDCTAIVGAWNVGCNEGVCEINSCAHGYKLSSDRKSCIAL